MVKADGCWPCPQHVAWQYPYLNYYVSLLAEPSLHGRPSCLNSGPCIFPAVHGFQGIGTPAFPSLKTETTDDMREFSHHLSAQPSLEEKHTGKTLQDRNPESLQKKFLIFDQSGNKTRLFYGPAFPHVQSPIFTATKFGQAYGRNEEGQTDYMGEKYLAGYRLPEASDKDHVVYEESEMHEDTEEINALLYSDDDDSKDDGDDDDDCDEVTSTGSSPLAIKRTHEIQEQFQDLKEEAASSDWPNKRLKLIDGGYNRSSPPGDSASLVRFNESRECVSDAESKYSSGCAYSMAGDIQSKKDKIRESLKLLENLVPGSKGKDPLLVIDGTIEYLKSMMSQIQYH